jgi:hypothetical protein
MLFIPFFYAVFIMIGCSLVWRILDFPRVARSPFLIAIVGLLICASGFFLQTEIHHSEHVSAWVAAHVPLLSADPAALTFFNKLVEMVVYAVGGGVVSSALLLRAQLRFAQDKIWQAEIKSQTEERITRYKDRLASLPPDAEEDQREALLQILLKQRKKLEKTTHILKSMGE